MTPSSAQQCCAGGSGLTHNMHHRVPSVHVPLTAHAFFSMGTYAAANAISYSIARYGQLQWHWFLKFFLSSWVAAHKLQLSCFSCSQRLLPPVYLAVCLYSLSVSSSVYFYYVRKWRGSFTSSEAHGVVHALGFPLERSCLLQQHLHCGPSNGMPPHIMIQFDGDVISLVSYHHRTGYVLGGRQNSFEHVTVARLLLLLWQRSYLLVV